jgi:hypothetical protein
MKGIVIVAVLALMPALLEAAVVLTNTSTGPGRQILTREIEPGTWRATPITTGSTDSILNSVVAEIQDSNPSGTLFMEVWTVGAFADPGAVVARLSLTGDTLAEKTFTGTVPLAANTSYFIVTGVDDGGGQWNEAVNFADPPGPDFAVDGGFWTLDTVFGGSSFQISYSSGNSGANWSADGFLEAPLRMTIDAQAVPEPSVLAFASAALTGAAFRRRRTQ